MSICCNESFVPAPAEVRSPAALRTAALVLLIWWLPAATEGRAAQRSDERALGRLFGDESLANVLELQRRTAELSAADRLGLLRQAVLPDARDAIRIDIEFAPHDLSERRAAELGLPSGWQSPLERLPAAMARGGTLLAPAIDLVELARELGRLDEIRSLVDQRGARPGADPRRSLAMQILLAIADDRFESAQDLTGQLQRSVANSPVLEAERGPEAVVIWRASAQPQTREAAYDLAFLVYEQARESQGPRSERWHRQIYALKYLLEHQGLVRQAASPPPAGNRWHPVTRMTAQTNGKGFPPASWEIRPGAATSLSGHDRDYLYYASPLTGNFTVEADTSTFNYRDIRLGYGGHWAGLAYDFKGVLNGHFRTDNRTQMLEVPLPEIPEPMRVRLDVRDGRRTTFVNGHPIFTEQASPSDPWLSIFSFWYTHGWVRNLRISGDPQVPDEIELATHTDLPGWVAYFDEDAGAPGRDWQLIEARRPALASPADSSSDRILVGARDLEQAGTRRESLLRYHRPILEDGRISYEFYYEPERFAVHPALGRSAFLLSSAGVQRHGITDGRFERTGLDPANVEPLAGVGGTDAPLPLKDSAWNEVALDVRGDQLLISLNGKLVARERFDRTVPPQFGLFHYADQTEARVRSLRWRGEWPRTVPPPQQQQLAGDEVEQLIAGKPLPMSFAHDFSAGIPLDQFLVIGEGWQQNFEQQPDGVRFRRIGSEGYHRYEIAPQLTLSGDFDITAEFSDLQTAIAAGGDANIQLFAGIEQQQTDCRLYRKFSRFSNKEHGEQIVQAGLFHTDEGHTTYEFPAKEPMNWSAGRLRLVRRGTRMHYLFAEQDSANFRLLHSTDVPAGDTRAGHVRLIVDTHKPGRTDVTWKSLVVRAEGMSGLATQPSLSIPELDDKRDRLNDRLRIDFGNADDQVHMSRFGDNAPFQPVRDALILNVPGTDVWRGAGVQSRFALQGDFDATLELDVPRLEPTVQGQESCVYLETQFARDGGRLVQLKHAISHHGTPTTEMVLRSRRPDGEFEYAELGSLPARSIHQLRIARRGTMAYFIVKHSPQRAPQLLGRLEVGTDPVPLQHLRAIVHTGGAGQTTIAHFRRLDVAADQITSTSATPAP